MIYELGNTDRYAIAASVTCMEKTSFFSVTPKEGVDVEQIMREAKGKIRSYIEGAENER